MRGNVDVVSEDWEIRFEFTDPVEVEFDGDKKELEIELTFRRRSGISAGV